MWKSDSEVHGAFTGASLLSRRKCVDDVGGYLVRDEIWFFLQQVSEEVKTKRKCDTGTLIC